jgi:hypothetical protein
LFKTNRLNVPIELIQQVQASKLHKSLGVYLMMKAACDGHIVLSKEQRRVIMAALGINTVRSFEKYLNKLITLNWIGFDKQTKAYYIRSFKTIRKENGFYRYRAVPFYISKDSTTITEFVQAAIICDKVVCKQHARKAKIIKVVGRSAFKKESAIQELVATNRITPYCGLSNELIGKCLGFGKSQADRCKKRLIITGYIKANAKYKQVCSFDKPDYLFLSHLPANRRYRLETTTHADNKTYIVLERTYDEIISCMEFTNQKAVVRRLKVQKN